MANSKDVSECRKRRKENLVKVLGGKCQICGFDSYVEAQEFHHESGEDKQFCISSGNTRSLVLYLEEIKKCYLLCSNCHRGVHAGYLKNPLEHIYLQDVAEGLVKGKHKKHYCVDCGKEICNTSIRCVSCAKQNARVVTWPDRDELKKLIRSLPFTQIGRRYGVNGNSIRKWCKRYGLPFRTSDIKKISDLDWENI